MLGRYLEFAVPGLQFATLAAGMTKLRGWHGAHGLDHCGHARQALDLGVVVYACTTGACSVIRRDRQLLWEY